ncbi:MAG: glycoside hydrolase family 35 protein [Lachnospiraceae bacterium]
MKLTYNRNGFYMDGDPIQIRSGAIHYFRVVPEYWEDRLLKLKQCGLNTVETYTCWNLHERKEGEFNFTGMLDLGRYLSLAEKLGLYVILRPGPYICAEWEMGGLPSWLLNIPDMKIRCFHQGFLEKVENYYKKLFEIVRPHFSTNGGCVIAMQIENEYGSFGDDQRYMRAVQDIYRKNLVDVCLFTSDGPGYFMLSGGSLPNVVPAINFGSNPKRNFELLREFRPDAPLFCAEYWNGWFDHWYEKHHERDSADTAQVYEQMLDLGASVSFYMFHGGTNFGFYNGANYENGIQPTVTSYDYNCPVSECGDLTEKYFSIKEVIEKKTGVHREIVAENLPKKAYGTVKLTEQADLFANVRRLQKSITSSYLMSMEELGQDFGFVLYESQMRGPFEKIELSIDGLHDRAQVYLDGKLLGIKEDTGKRNDVITLGMKSGESGQLSILVENMGRVNYGGHIWEKKGILGGVRIANRYHYDWKMYCVTCENLAEFEFFSVEKDDLLVEEKIEGLAVEQAEEEKIRGRQWSIMERPTVYRGFFQVEEGQRADTFVRLDGFIKGNVWINGFNLGRYWNIAGPQKTLYLPAPLLREGKNEIWVLELEGCEKAEIALIDYEILG